MHKYWLRQFGLKTFSDAGITAQIEALQRYCFPACSYKFQASLLAKFRIRQIEEDQAWVGLHELANVLYQLAIGLGKRLQSLLSLQQVVILECQVSQSTVGFHNFEKVFET